jgi:hypothetical protein
MTRMQRRSSATRVDVYVFTMHFVGRHRAVMSPIGGRKRSVNHDPEVSYSQQHYGNLTSC